MKKVILWIFIFSIVNSINILAMDENNNNNNNNIKIKQFPKEIWREIFAKFLINIEKIKEARTLPELKDAVKDLFPFFLISKFHNEIAKEIVNKKINVDGNEITLKEFYIKKKKEIVKEEIKKILREELSCIDCYICNFDFNQIDQRINDGWTLLMFASQMGNIKLAELLIKNGADINAHNKYDYTALIIAAANGKKEMVEFLINHGADINLGNVLWKPWLIATFYGYNDISELIMKYKNEQELRNNNVEKRFVGKYECIVQ